VAIMAESFGTELTIVQVTADDPSRPKKQLYCGLSFGLQYWL